MAVFALNGATINSAAGGDAAAILFAAFATALLGGILRDLLLRRIPPATLCRVRYPAVALAAGAAVCLFGDRLSAVPPVLLTVLNAAALGLFCVTGALTSFAHRAGALAAVLLGALSAVGGGPVRDLLRHHVPLMFSVNLYVALAGAAVTVLVLRSGRSRARATAAGMTAAVVLCLLAGWQHWGLPVPG